HLPAQRRLQPVVRASAGWISVAFQPRRCKATKTKWLVLALGGIEPVTTCVCSSPVSGGRRRRRGAVLGPGVPWVAAHQPAADGWVVPFPEPCQVGGDLLSAAVGREQVEHDRHLAAGHARSRAHPEEVLQAGARRWRLSRLVLDEQLAAA